MGKRRVVITGVGMVTPSGLRVAETWQHIIAGNNNMRGAASGERGRHLSLPGLYIITPSQTGMFFAF